MTTINISLPTQLKSEAEELVENGLYVSFSDLVRDSIRKLIADAKYDMLYLQTKRDYKNGKATVIKSQKDIDDYFEKL
jgi:Arc/MetJ-type ribon-helix-helix transcriptional regulator